MVIASPVRAYASDSTDPETRGLRLGRDRGPQVRAALAAYRELWAAYRVGDDEVRDVGTAVLDPVAAYAPDLRAELAGIAEGSGLAEWEIGALNARSELLALGDQRLIAAGLLPGEGLSECSAFVRLDAPATTDRTAGPITAQTWDWHRSLRDHWFVWSLQLTDGREVDTLTEFGIVGKIGVARWADGGALSVHFNALRHGADTGNGGVPVHIVARRILDEARTVDEALTIADKAEVTASAAVTVTGRSDAGWTAASLELRPGGPSVAAAGDGWLAHTNHFVAADVEETDQVSSAVSTTRPRLDRVCGVAAGDPPLDRDAAAARLATHDLGPRSVCVHGFPELPVGQASATLAVAVTEPADGRLHVHGGLPCEVSPGGWWSS